MIKVGIVGGTGYTGVELLRILVKHPKVELVVITSRSEAGKHVAELFPSLSGLLELHFSKPDVQNLGECDVVFIATPNGVAMAITRDILDRGIKVIDLSADFRFSDKALWSKWYGTMEHTGSDLLAEAAYGLCELNRDVIKKSQLVGNPGCYPTAVQLALAPLLKGDAITKNKIIADCKSGISGAGRSSSVANLQAESAENFKAYAVSGHRHQPEIEHNISKFIGDDVKITFVPHLVPMIRGIHATIYTELVDEDLEIAEIFTYAYADEPFVDVLGPGVHPETRWVRGSNNCKISWQRHGSTLILLAVIDNLIKGASGQAVQNMNIMCGLRETDGLDHVALLP